MESKNNKEDHYLIKTDKAVLVGLLITLTIILLMMAAEIIKAMKKV
jgi:hypothetical protein